MKVWKVTMRHDSGLVSITTSGDTPGAAAAFVCMIERAPLRSVVSIEPVEIIAQTESFALTSGYSL